MNNEDLKSLFVNYSQQIRKNLTGMKIGEIRNANVSPKTNYHYQSQLPSVVSLYFNGQKFKTKKKPGGGLLVMRVQ